jgi:hypothetical protein
MKFLFTLFLIFALLIANVFCFLLALLCAYTYLTFTIIIMIFIFFFNYAGFSILKYIYDNF